MEEEIKKPEDIENIVSHLTHVTYPVTGRAFLEACNNMSDVSDEQRAYVTNNIEPDKTYASVEEIRHDLNL